MEGETLTNQPRTGRSFKPFKQGQTLFGETHPELADSPTTDDEADALDEWFHLLLRVTARAIWHTVTSVHDNYTNHRRDHFVGQQLGRLLALYDVIAYDLRPGPHALDTTAVGVQIQRCVKTFGLVTYPLEPGPRHSWPAAPRLITMTDAVRVADAAFRGEWPCPPPVGTPLGQHDPMAALAALDM